MTGCFRFPPFLSICCSVLKQTRKHMSFVILIFKGIDIMLFIHTLLTVQTSLSLFLFCHMMTIFDDVWRRSMDRYSISLIFKLDKKLIITSSSSQQPQKNNSLSLSRDRSDRTRTLHWIAYWQLLINYNSSVLYKLSTPINQCIYFLFSLLLLHVLLLLHKECITKKAHAWLTDEYNYIVIFEELFIFQQINKIKWQTFFSLLIFFLFFRD
jgi:hypothetical protein